MTTETTQFRSSRHVDAKKIFFDWSGVVAIAMGAMAWGASVVRLNVVEAEIARLRTAAEEHNRESLVMARTLATEVDLQRVEDKVTALQARRDR